MSISGCHKAEVDNSTSAVVRVKLSFKPIARIIGIDKLYELYRNRVIERLGRALVALWGIESRKLLTSRDPLVKVSRNNIYCVFYTVFR